MLRRPSETLVRAVPFVLVVAMGFGAFFGLTSFHRAPSQRNVEKLAPLVQTVSANRGGSSMDLEAQGEAVPYREVTLSAEVAGRIDDKSEVCQAGHFVEADCVLLKIFRQDYDLEVQRIQETIKETEVRIEESDVQFANNERMITLAQDDLQLQENDLARVKSLMSQRVASQSALDTAQRARIQARNVLQTLENQARLIRTQRNRYLREKSRLLVELEKAILDRERTVIRAPISGVITEDIVEEGDYVQRGAALARLEDTSRVEVSFDLKLDELRWIWAGAGQRAEALSESGSYALPPLPVEIQFKVYEHTFTWQAVLDRYDGAGINPATRTVPCVAVVNRPRGGKFASSEDGTLPGPPALLRGMFVNVKIDVPTAEPLIELPVTALRPGNRVWVYDDGRLSIREVQLAQVLDDRVLVFPQTSQISEGDDVIVSALAMPIDGMEVRQERPTAVAEATSRESRSATKAVASEVAR